MKELVFATNNLNKVREIQDLIGNKFRILGLNDIGYHKEIIENQMNIEGNAEEKANLIFNLFHINCFADDTGLEVEALDGQPGVFSARFAECTGELNQGEDISEANIRKLLKLMKDKENRKARFRTVISLILDGKKFFFEGIVNGHIMEKKEGGNGFGYDPVFKPAGFNQTFAELTLQQKNKISHRAIAINKMMEFLLNLKINNKDY
jgi:XTP/dITP diphosphohydrolase